MSDVDVLKSRLPEWKDRLSGSDVHSIGPQIARLLWRSAFYRSLNESRRFLPDGTEGRKRANESLHELIDDGYFIANLTALRRLLDKGSTSGLRGVYSLLGLIRDVRDNVMFITRANVLEARGLEYDFEPIRQRAREDAWQGAKAKGDQAFFISPDGWAESEYWHRVMDRLCGVEADNRSSCDTPDQNKLEWLLNELEGRGRNVQGWVDKFVAHAASPVSRQTLHLEQQSMSLAKLWLAERVVVRTASFVSHNFVNGTNIGGVPVPQFDQFAHLDGPFIHASALPAMHRAWRQHCNEISSCENWFWDSALADAPDVWKDHDE